MRRRAYELEKRIPEIMGPPPGPEQLVLDQLDDAHFAWHLEHEGRLIAPDQAPGPWQRYMDATFTKLGHMLGTGVAIPAGQKHRG